VPWIEVSTTRDVCRLEAYLCGERKQPVVVLTRMAYRNEPVLSPEGVRALVGPAVRIYYVTSERLLSHMRDALGPKLAVTNGAARIWWPELTSASDPAEHPLVIVSDHEQPTEVLAEFARQFDLSRPDVFDI
jgi:hypothetical protein